MLCYAVQPVAGPFRQQHAMRASLIAQDAAFELALDLRALLVPSLRREDGQTPAWHAVLCLLNCESSSGHLRMDMPNLLQRMRGIMLLCLCTNTGEHCCGAVRVNEAYHWTLKPRYSPKHC